MSNKLYEFTSFEDANIKLTEQVGTDGSTKDLFMQGLFIQGDVRNHNQRVYPLSEITKAVETVKEQIQSGYSVLGELDHPEELTINLDRASHLITDISLQGANGYGKLKILDTPMGNIAKSLLTGGAKLGVSSRGSGNVGHDGTVSDFEIVTVDIVAQPSAPGAYPKTIYESLYNMRGGSQVFETAKAATYDAGANTYLQKDIIKLINELRKL